MLNCLLNMWWGISIFYSMSTGHCLNDFFWTFLGVFVFMLGFTQLVYFFIFPGKSGEVLNKPIGGQGRPLTVEEMLIMFRETYVRESRLQVG